MEKHLTVKQLAYPLETIAGWEKLDNPPVKALKIKVQ